MDDLGKSEREARAGYLSLMLAGLPTDWEARNTRSPLSDRLAARHYELSSSVSLLALTAGRA